MRVFLLLLKRGFLNFFGDVFFTTAAFLAKFRSTDGKGAANKEGWARLGSYRTTGYSLFN